MERMLVQIGPVYMVPSPGMLLGLTEKQRRYPDLPDINRMLEDLRTLNSQQGVPATIYRDKNTGRARLVLYCATYYIGLYELEHHDGYTIAHIDVLKLQDHEQLSQGVLWLKSQHWLLCTDFRMVPSMSHSYWGAITTAWQQWEQARVLPGVLPRPMADRSAAFVEDTLKPAYQRYLNQVRLVIQIAHALEQNRAGQYASQPGNADPAMSAMIVQIQQQAVKLLRDGNGHNKHLLSVLVDQCYMPYELVQATPVQALHPEQLETFRRALSVPDMLLVPGLSGLVKTHLLTEIVRACAQQRWRVLVVAKTQQAIDSVLEQLPDALKVVRLGSKEQGSPHLQSKLLEAQAQQLQRLILRETAGHTRSLAPFVETRGTIAQHTGLLKQQILQLRQGESSLMETRQKSAVLERQIIDPLTRRAAELDTLQNQLWMQMEQRRKKIAQLQQKQAVHAGRASMTLLGFIFNWLAQRCLAAIQSEHQALQGDLTIFETNTNEFNWTQQQLPIALPSNLTYRGYQESIERQLAANKLTKQQCLDEIRLLNKTLLDLVASVPPLGEVSVESLERYALWYEGQKTKLELKAQLLMEWRGTVGAFAGQLYAEVLCYADVVGASYRELATAKGLENLNFDLVLVDEAVQIALPDLLIPLVRARRAVLFGEYQHLPPFVASEVQAWLTGLSPRQRQELGLWEEEEEKDQLKELLITSTFERLFTAKRDSKT